MLNQFFNSVPNSSSYPGLHAWVVFCLVGLTLAVLAHREGLPLSFKTCFYPLIGNTIYTWIGDVIDSLAVAVVFINFCMQLPLSVSQLNSGLNYLIEHIPRKDYIQVSVHTPRLRSLLNM